MIKYTDAYVETLARAHLQPGEQVLGRAAGVYRPFWTMGIMYLWKHYLVVATSQRLLLIEHRRGLLYDRLETLHSIGWHEVLELKVAGLMKKKLRMKFQSQRPNLTLRLPGLFAPMPKNVAGAKQVAQSFQQAKQLSAGTPSSLPPGAPMGQHQSSTYQLHA